MPQSVVPYEIAETIRRKKAQYCRFADTNQWHLFPLIALPTATFKFVDKDEQTIRQNDVDFNWDSLAGFQDFFSETNKHLDGVHMVNAGELELVGGGDDEIKAVFTVVYHVGALGTETGMHGTGAGHYHETWKRVDGDWFLAALWMQRTYWKIQGI